MSLAYYEQKFSALNVNRSNGKVSPHKVAMLLAVMDLISEDKINDNKIFYNQDLLSQFTINFSSLANRNDRNNPHLPFFHLSSSGFWHFKAKPGQLQELNNKTRISSSSEINRLMEYVYLDDELFELLNNEIIRKLFKVALFENLIITNQVRENLLTQGNPRNWDWIECEATVISYFEMLEKELSDEKYVKVQSIRLLSEKLDKRTEKAIEFKYQNISAVLIELGFPYIDGFKPAFNYQKQLYQTILAHIAASPLFMDQQAKPQMKYEQAPHYDDYNSHIVSTIPERVSQPNQPKRSFLARKTNFSQVEANNKVLGRYGEEFVLGFEKYRLQNLGRNDLAKEVSWSSEEEGDGLGYDIRSFTVDEMGEEQELFVEVKTTNQGKYQPFYISSNEVVFSQEYSQQYSLYRVFQYKKSPRLFMLPGAVQQHVHLSAKNYQAGFGK